MPHLHQPKSMGRTTIKTPTLTLAIFSGGLGSDRKLERASQIGREIARNGHNIAISDLNPCTLAAISNAQQSGGSTIGYISSRQRLNTFAHKFTDIVITAADYSESCAKMLQVCEAALFILDRQDELRQLAEPVPDGVLIGVLTDYSDLSHHLLDFATMNGQGAEAYLIDSSPTSLVKRMLKRLRQQQLAGQLRV